MNEASMARREREREDIEVVQPTVTDMATRPIELQMHELIPRMELARKLPRKTITFKTHLREESLGDPGVMVFRKPGKDESGRDIEIIGPSVRMAEIAARLFSNLDVGPPIFTHQEGMVTATVRVLDLESNVSEVGTSTTSLVKRDGRTRMPAFVVANLTMATASKAFRNAVTKIVGKSVLDDLVGPCLEAAEKAEQSKLDAEKTSDNSGQLWAKHVAGWARAKISEADLLKACGIESPSQVTGKHIARLNTALQSVKEGIAPRVALGLESEYEATPPGVDDYFAQQGETAAT